ncbi:Tc toxin subunit A [Yersinia enterocolitica]
MLHENSKPVSLENKMQADKRAQQLRNDPVLHGITKLNALDEVKPLHTSTSLTDNAIPERAEKYVVHSSIQSMFSPGRYLCELYHVAQELHTDKNSLHIDQRRPDLKDLVLSDENANQEVSTLDILLETLKKTITLDKLAAVEGKYDDDSFTLPYDDNLTIINTVLESKSIRLRDIAVLSADDIQQVKLTPALVQEQLGLNPASYGLLNGKSPLTDNKRLAHATKLTVSQLNKLIADIQDNSRSTNEQILTVLSEYVRLNHQYGLSVDQLFAIIRKIDDSATGEIIPQLFGLSSSQAEMLLTLSDKSEVIKNITQGDISTTLSAISELENIVQWMGEQKLDLAAFNAMLTTQYSAIATAELFNFLANIYHSMDKQTDAIFLKQNLCRSLAAGFHLKTEVVTGLVSWLESNDKEFELEKFSKAITEVFADNPTLETLEHHPGLVTQCQKLSQYVLIAQWAKLTQQDIEFLLQPKLVNGNEKPLQPGLPLLRLLADFKAWQQQVKVPVSEALRYFSVLGTYDESEKLEEENKTLADDLLKEKEKIEKQKKTSAKQINDKYEPKTKKIAEDIEEVKGKIDETNKELNSITSNDIASLLKKAQCKSELNYFKQLLETENYKSTSNTNELKSELEKNNIKYQQEEKELSKKTNDKINKNRWAIKNHPSRAEKLAKIHGWDYMEVVNIIESIFPKKSPMTFSSVNRLYKNINLISQCNITAKDLLNLTSLASEMDNKELKSDIESTAKELIASL